jgi:hypothetical protein
MTRLHRGKIGVEQFHSLAASENFQQFPWHIVQQLLERRVVAHGLADHDGQAHAVAQ